MEDDTAQSWIPMQPGAPPYEACGLATVEKYYGEPISIELITRVRETPDDQLAELAIRVAHAYRPWLDPWAWVMNEPFGSALELGHDYDEPGFRHLPAPWPSGMVVEPRVAYHSHTPLVARVGLPMLLLVAPRLLVVDNIAEWAGSLSRSFPYSDENPWSTRGRYDERSGNPQTVLASILTGLAPVARYIRSGVIVMSPDATSDYTSGFGVGLEDVRRVISDGGLNNFGGTAREWSRSADAADRIGDAYMEAPYIRASRFSALARVCGGLMAPTTLERFFPSANAPAAVGVAIPTMELGVGDALAMRDSEQVFFTLHAAIDQIAKRAGRHVNDEPLASYAQRVAIAADIELTSFDDEMRLLISRGKLFGAVSSAASGVMRFAAGALLPWMPGAGGAAAAVSKRTADTVWSEQHRSAHAAERAIYYAANLRLTGFM